MHPRARPRRVGFYVSGQLLTEDYYVFNKLAKGLIGTNNIDTNSRLCMSQRGGRLQGDARRRRAARAATRTSTTRDCMFIAGSNTACAHPILFRRIEDAKRAQPGAEDHRRRPAPHRHRRARRPAPADPARHRRRAVQRHAARDAVGGPDRPRLHRRAHQRLRRAARRACATTRRAWPRRSAASREADLVTAARWFARARRPTLSLYCQGLNQSRQRHRQERRADQPAPGHRPDRQARRRAVLADRPAQRDGRARGRRHGQPAVRRIATSAIPQHRAEVARAVGRRRACRRSPARPRSRCSRPLADGEIKALWIACTNPAQSMPDQADGARARWSAPSSWCVQEAFADTATCALRRPAAAGHHLGREGRHRHQLRAPHLRACAPRCRARARRAHDWAHRRRFRAPAGGAAAPGRSRRCFAYADAGAVLERAPRDHARPRPRHHRPELRACSSAAARSSGRSRAARTTGTRAAVRRRRLPDRRRPRALRRRRAYEPLAEPRDARYPFCADHRPPARPVARHEPHRHARPRCSAMWPSRRIEMHAQDMARRAAGRRRPGARHLAARLASCVPVQAERAGGARRRPSSRCTGARSTWAAAAAPARALAGVNALTTRPSARARSSPSSSTRR